MAKKFCEKHYRYVATCPECRKMNEAQEPEKIVEPEIPLYANVDDSEDRAPPPDRFHYMRRIPPARRKRLLIIGLVKIQMNTKSIFVLVGLLKNIKFGD